MRSLIFTTVLVVMIAGAAFAADTTQAPAPMAKPSAMAGKMTIAKPLPGALDKPMRGRVKAEDRSAISKACSAQADAKGLHGKERSNFRNSCKKKG